MVCHFFGLGALLLLALRGWGLRVIRINDACTQTSHKRADLP